MKKRRILLSIAVVASSLIIGTSPLGTVVFVGGEIVYVVLSGCPGADDGWFCWDDKTEPVSLPDVTAGGTPNEAAASPAISTDILKALTRLPQPGTIVVLGHIDHGKTTLVSAISRVSERYGGTFVPVDSIERAILPEDERVSTIALTKVGIRSRRRAYTFADFRGHSDIVRSLVIGQVRPDAALLVVSAVDGPMPQTRVQLRLAGQLRIPRLVVALTKIDALDDEGESVAGPVRLYVGNVPDTATESDLRAHLEGAAPVRRVVLPVDRKSKQRRGFALIEVASGASADAIVRRFNGHVFQGRALSIGDVDPPSRRSNPADKSEPFADLVEQEIRAMLADAGFDAANTPIVRVSALRALRGDASATRGIVRLMDTIDRRVVPRAAAVASPETVAAHRGFEAQIYLLSQDEGGRATPVFNGYRPEVYIRTRDVRAALELPKGTEMLMPGDNGPATFQLVTAVTLEAGEHFAVRENGRVVGAGFVTRLID